MVLDFRRAAALRAGGGVDRQLHELIQHACGEPGHPSRLNRVEGKSTDAPPSLRMAAWLQRYHICEEHMAAEEVILKGLPHRFCQQVGGPKDAPPHTHVAMPPTALNGPPITPFPALACAVWALPPTAGV